MPGSHWSGYKRFIESNIALPGFRECWREIGRGFSEDFAAWMDGLIDAQPAAHSD